MTFHNLKLIQEYPTMINGKYPFRLYQTDFKNDEDGKRVGNKVRYHFGWPEFIVKPLSVMLETTLYWGETHWTEHEGFYIYWLPVSSKEGEIPYGQLNKDMKFRFRMFNDCLNQVRKWEKIK